MHYAIPNFWSVQLTLVPVYLFTRLCKYITNESTALQRAWGTLPPSIVFTHVPSHDFAVAQQDPPTADKVGGVTNETSSNFTSVAKTYPGLNDDNPFGGQGGESRELSSKSELHGL